MAFQKMKSNGNVPNQMLVMLISKSGNSGSERKLIFTRSSYCEKKDAADCVIDTRIGEPGACYTITSPDHFRHSLIGREASKFSTIESTHISFTIKLQNLKSKRAKTIQLNDQKNVEEQFNHALILC